MLSRSPEPVTPLKQAQAVLEKALQVARNVRDARAESFALGTLGSVYETTGQYDVAIALTRQAQFMAQTVNAADSLYRWQWQMGRILRQTGKIPQAIAAYEQAIASLQSIRSDIVVANQDLQFDFRDSVEPVYRELIGLLLGQDSPPSPKASVDFRPTPPDPKLKSLSIPPSSPLAAGTTPVSSRAANSRTLAKVLDILELLKLAELQNFFGDDCVQVAKDGLISEAGGPFRGSGKDPTLAETRTIVVYSIVLENRTNLIVRLLDGSLKTYPVMLPVNGVPTPAGDEQLQIRIDRLRSLLEKRSTEEYLTEAQVIYDALIRPLAADLQASNPKTLVFINDGVLRKVPMAALHDGKHFLIEKYAIATTPSLSLTSRRPLKRENLRALIMGLTVEQPPFSALPNVGSEVREVQEIMGGTQLVDQDFTLTRMQERLKNNNYSVIHMATHGKFGTDAETTFLLSYSDRITIEKLDQLLRRRSGGQPVELLTLSACQTATGDNRSALGIAGVAVRAGVKSALATLWFINDEATLPLIEEFYSQLLQPGTTKAEALQRAQVKLISDRQYSHPAVWSPFILIGNWM
jgi:CHAT domain-containing protein